MYTQEKENNIKKIYNIIKEVIKTFITPPPPGNINEQNKGTLKERLLS
jgi:hypothetical protein